MSDVTDDTVLRFIAQAIWAQPERSGELLTRVRTRGSSSDLSLLERHLQGRSPTRDDLVQLSRALRKESDEKASRLADALDWAAQAG